MALLSTLQHHPVSHGSIDCRKRNPHGERYQQPEYAQDLKTPASKEGQYEDEQGRNRSSEHAHHSEQYRDATRRPHDRTGKRARRWNDTPSDLTCPRRCARDDRRNAKPSRVRRSPPR